MNFVRRLNERLTRSAADHRPMGVHPDTRPQFAPRFAGGNLDFAPIRGQRLPERLACGKRLLGEMKPQAAQLQQALVFVPRIALTDVEQQVAVALGPDVDADVTVTQRHRAKRINTIIKTLDNGSNVRFLDLWDTFHDLASADANCRVKKDLLNKDLLHLDRKGYEMWSDTMKPLSSEILAGK